MKKYLFGLLICCLFITGCGKVELIDGESALVKLNDKSSISTQDLYDKLVNLYGIDFLIDLVDTELLNELYEEDESELIYVNEAVASIKEQAGDDFENYIKMYNVTTEKELKEYIRLNYRRELYRDEFAKESVTDKQIEEYYETVAIGDIEASHILITSSATESMTDEEKSEAETEAYNKAKEIIDKLNNGENFAELAKEYSQDAANATEGGALGYFNYDDNFDSNFMSAAVELEVGEYSKTPVKSAFGYHIIYKTNQKEKESLEDIENEIRNTIASEQIESDTTLLARALKSLREENNMEILDSNLESEYTSLVGE